MHMAIPLIFVLLLVLVVAERLVQVRPAEAPVLVRSDEAQQLRRRR